MVVRHKVLGVGPKHGLVLQDAEMGRQTDKEDGKRKKEGDRQKKKKLDQQQLSTDSTRQFQQRPRGEPQQRERCFIIPPLQQELLPGTAGGFFMARRALTPPAAGQGRWATVSVCRNPASAGQRGKPGFST